jgi:hypothetical protein
LATTAILAIWRFLDSRSFAAKGFWVSFLAIPAILAIWQFFNSRLRFRFPMNQPQRGSAGFYKGMAIVFFVLGGVFIWAAVRQHSWFYGAFGAITVVNGLMSIVRSRVAGAAGR